MKKNIILIILIFFCLQFLSCAKRVFPSGGEGDKIPPRILSISPENQSLNVNPKTKIQVQFSEWINPKNIENAIFISPQVEFSVKVNTRNLEVIPKSPLKKNTSFHVSFLGDIADFSGNRLLETQTIIFSTGDFIDSSFIDGRIFFEKTDTLIPKAALFFDERTTQNDTILLSMPDYITQADSNGFFRFDNIADEKYRVVGFLDKNRNNRINPGETVFIGVEKIVDTQNFVELFPATSDTVQNRISSVSAFSPTVLSIKLKFASENRPFDNLRIENIRLDKIHRLEDNQTIAVFLKDSLQNQQYSLETRARRIILMPDDTIFYDTIRFNGTTLEDTLNLARLDSLIAGKPINDTEKSDSIETTVKIAVSPKLLWNFHGELPANPLWELRNEKGISIFTRDNFVENIPVGKYTLFLIDDRNKNGKFDVGTLFPWIAGEKRIIFPDILTARERWEAEYEIKFEEIEDDYEEKE